jgi:hypothetical protein
MARASKKPPLKGVDEIRRRIFGPCAKRLRKKAVTEGVKLRRYF